MTHSNNETIKIVHVDKLNITDEVNIDNDDKEKKKDNLTYVPTKIEDVDELDYIEE